MYLDMNEQLPDVTAYEKELAKLVKVVVKDKNGTEYNISAPDIDQKRERIAYLDEQIAKGHCYKFVGRVGQFCPIKPGCFGGKLVRLDDDDATKRKSYSSVAGAKDYRWLESETVLEQNRQHEIDMSYFEKLADDAVADISKYGDYTWFVSDEPYVFASWPFFEHDDIPF
jgi:hypothetical protein